MNVAVSDLETTVPWATDTGFVRGLPRAQWLLDNLHRSVDVLQTLRNATEVGKAVLSESAHTGLTRVNESVRAINGSLNLAFSIGIGGPRLTKEAQFTLDNLEYLREVRLSLRGAIDEAESVLKKRQGKLSNDAEEKAMDDIRNAVTWARELQLPIATALNELAKMKHVVKVKDSMTEALALGEASMKAKAGVEDARELIDLLHARLSTKHHLNQAETEGKQALASDSGYKHAIAGLESAMDEAEEQGLDELMVMAQTLLDALYAARDNTEKMKDLEHKGKGYLEDKEDGDLDGKGGDKRDMRVLKRSGYRVKDLPDPDGAYDDGDKDFDEHILVLEAAINRAHRRGEIDPRWEVMIKEMEKKQR